MQYCRGGPHADAFAGIAAAIVQAASGKTDTALNRLKAIFAETRKSGYRTYQFQARLALARIEIKSGKTAAHRWACHDFGIPTPSTMEI